MIPLNLPDGWRFEDGEPASLRRRTGVLSAAGGQEVPVTLERCVRGRLAGTYPPGEHDVEVQVQAGDRQAEVLGVLGRGVLDADPECHRVVYAAPAGDVSAIGAAESVGYRYVVDVDLPDAELSLLVLEPESVARQPAEVAEMPQQAEPQALT